MASTKFSKPVDEEIASLAGQLTSKSAKSGGTALSMVTTGEKYTWNNKCGSLIVDTFNCIPGSTTTAEYSKNVSKSGYTPLGVVGMQAIGSYQPIENLAYWYLSGTTFLYRTTAPSATSGLKVYILYRANS